jgi:hypothetical protein
MAHLFPLNMGDPCDTGASSHGERSDTPIGASTPCEQGGSTARVGAIGVGACA